MLQDARLCVQVAYIRAMLKSWTMLGTTGKVRYETYQLVWCLVTQIASDNPHVTSVIHRLL